MCLKYLLENPGNLLEFCYHDLLDTLHMHTQQMVRIQT